MAAVRKELRGTLGKPKKVFAYNLRQGTWIVTYKIVFFPQNGNHKHEIIFLINDLMSILLKISAPIFRNSQIINNYVK